MTAALVVGAMAGVGLLALAWAIVPPRRDLAAAVAMVDQRRPSTVGTGTEGRPTQDRVGRWLVTQLERRGVTVPTLRANLALLDRSLEAHMIAKVTTAGVGLLLPVLLSGVLATVGTGIGWTVPLLVGLALAVAFSFLPDVSVAAAASERRNDLRRALSCYLDLVSMALAGGRGAPEALPSASQLGRGWAFELIGDTVAGARLSGITPWDGLRELGERVDVTELRDLGSALSLVADDGAKVRESLRARASTARKRQLAEAEGSAEKASNSIQNAHLFLGFSFLLFLGYPAVAAVMAI